MGYLDRKPGSLEEAVLISRGLISEVPLRISYVNDNTGATDPIGFAKDLLKLSDSQIKVYRTTIEKRAADIENLYGNKFKSDRVIAVVQDIMIDVTDPKKLKSHAKKLEKMKVKDTSKR